jgi:recombination protein U
MKQRSYANRGATFEEYIKYANGRYRQAGLAFIQKQCTEFIPLRDRTGKISGAKVEHKATFDFLGRYKNHPIAVEAKNTNVKQIRFDRVEWNQYVDMNDFTKEQGTIGLVLISFNLERFFAVPWAFWAMAFKIRVEQRNLKANACVSAYGQTWDIPKKASVRADELLPEWEVSGSDWTYSLHYLQKADNYVN